MAGLKILNKVHPYKSSASKPRIAISGKGYLELTTNSGFAPTKPRMNFDISGKKYYIREIFQRPTPSAPKAVYGFGSVVLTSTAGAMITWGTETKVSGSTWSHSSTAPRSGNAIAYLPASSAGEKSNNSSSTLVRILGYPILGKGHWDSLDAYNKNSVTATFYCSPLPGDVKGRWNYRRRPPFSIGANGVAGKWIEGHKYTTDCTCRRCGRDKEDLITDEFLNDYADLDNLDLIVPTFYSSYDVSNWVRSYKPTVWFTANGWGSSAKKQYTNL